MTVDIVEFWKLVVDSKLLTADECQRLGDDFGKVKGAAKQGNARTLAEWLIAQDVMTRYQAKIVLGGRAGPFLYGDYKLCDRIKRGVLGGAFRAVHTATNHPVILRFLTGSITQDPQQWTAAAQRADAHCTVVHPHLVRCHELVDLAGYKFLVMESLTGDSLDRVLAEAAQRLAPAEACRIARQAALGLAQLHQAGHVYGNIRPAALWMESGGNVKLPHDPLMPPSPFEYRVVDPTREIAERADYAAPELIQQGRAPDRLSDIYSLGCTLYFLLAGRPPFSGGDASQKMSRHATEAIQSLDQIAAVPPATAQTVTYMMAKNPAVRYQTASELADALGQFVDLSHTSGQPGLNVPTLPAFEQWINRKRAAMAVQAMGGGAAAVAVTPQPKESFPTVEELTAKKTPAGGPSRQSDRAAVTTKESAPVAGAWPPGMSAPSSASGSQKSPSSGGSAQSAGQSSPVAEKTTSAPNSSPPAASGDAAKEGESPPTEVAETTQAAGKAVAKKRNLLIAGGIGAAVLLLLACLFLFGPCRSGGTGDPDGTDEQAQDADVEQNGEGDVESGEPADAQDEP